MEFVELTEKEFSDFSKNHEYTSFFQTVAWGRSKEKVGWKVHLVGVKEKKKTIAATMILEKSLIKKIKLFYSPRGFLIDYRNQELLTFFIDNLKSYAKKKKALFIKIDPYVENYERDNDGNIVENGYSNNDIITILESHGFKHQGFNLEQDNKLQGRWLFVTPTKGKTIKEIDNDMKRSAKRAMVKTEKLGIKVIKGTEDDIEEFYNIMKDTSDRRSFSSRPLSYYKNMYHELYKDGLCDLYFASLDTKDVIAKLSKEIKEKKEGLKVDQEIFDKAEVLSDTLRKYKGNMINVPKFNERQEKRRNELVALESQLEEVKAIKDGHGDNVILSGIFEIYYGDEVIGLYGGTYKEFIKYSPFNPIHHKMLEYACENNLKQYNYYAISGNLSKDDSQYGIYYTKRNFGGKVVELIGEFDLVLNKPLYFLYKIAFATKIKLKQIKSKF